MLIKNVADLHAVYWINLKGHVSQLFVNDWQDVKSCFGIEESNFYLEWNFSLPEYEEYVKKLALIFAKKLRTCWPWQNFPGSYIKGIL